MFKNLSLFQKLLFFFNCLAVLLLAAACFVPYISSERYAFLAFLSLGVPLLVIANFLFFLFWLYQRKRQMLLSLLILVIGYFSLGAFIKVGLGESEAAADDLKVMSYNVRVFNKFGEMASPNVFDDIKAFVDEEKPDVICFQEVDYVRQKEYEDYPYRYLEYIHKQDKVLLGIFSKYPIINTELLDFPGSPNEAACADILYKNDTIRIYNMHLQSLGITHTRANSILDQQKSKRILKKMTEAFGKQQQQAKLVKEHMQANSYPQILCGDFNNSQFSNAYKTIRGEKNDSFIEQGFGYGRTLNYHRFPVRIDFILSDPVFEVKSHKTYDVEYSDHYPVMASFKLGAH